MSQTPTLAPGIGINVATLLETRLLVQASSGGGKSWALRRLLEQTANHVQHLIIDPEGEFATLREKFDYIVAAPHDGDALAHPRTAALLARRLLETGVSAVLDIYDLKAHERQTFVRLFCEAMVNAPRSLWRPALLVIDEAHVFCLDEETEILTPVGWRKHHEIDAGHEAITFDPAAGSYGQEKIRRVIRKQHAGPMVRLRSDGIDCVVTPEHRVVLRREQRAKNRRRLYDWSFCDANRVPCHSYIPSGGAPFGKGCGLSANQIRALGWIITDGSIDRTKRYLSIEQAVTTVKKGERITERMDAVLSEVGCVGRYVTPSKVAKDGIRRAESITYYLGVELSTELLEWLGADIHRVPRAILESGSKEELEALYEGLLEGDGTAVNGGWKVFYPGHNEGLADDFQELATRLSISTTKKFNTSTGQWNVLISKRRHHYVRKPETAHYDGLVWCITVPSGAFVARRRGKVFVTGNCPEGSRSESAGAVIDVVTRGRKHGFGTVLATQRLSKLHKDAAAEMGNKLIGRTGLDIDVKRAADELGMSPRDAMDALRKLQPGEFFAFGPALAMAPTRIAVGAVSTRHPKAGERLLSPPPAPSEKIRAALRELADLPAAAEEEAKTVDDLRREVSDLKRRLAAAEKRPPVDESALTSAKVEIDNLRARLDSLNAALSSVKQTAASALAMQTPRAAPRMHAEQWSPEELERIAKRANGPITLNRAPETKANVSEGVTGAKKRILDALAQLEVFGLTTPDRRTVAAHAGINPNGGYTSNTIGALRTAGLLEYPTSGALALTDAGRRVATYPEKPPTLADLHASWLSIVSGIQQRILKAVIDAHPEALSRQALAATVGASEDGGYFTNSIGALRTLGAIDYPRKGWVVATEAVFPKCS